jgi:hypothetical protein
LTDRPATLVGMTAQTMHRPDTDSPDGQHGPAEVRAAIVACGNDLTVEMFDRNMDKAYRESPEALRTFLDYWWMCAAVARGEMDPPARSRRLGSEQFVADWEAAHPGQKLPV